MTVPSCKIPQLSLTQHETEGAKGLGIGLSLGMRSDGLDTVEESFITRITQLFWWRKMERVKGYLDHPETSDQILM